MFKRQESTCPIHGVFHGISLFGRPVKCPTCLAEENEQFRQRDEIERQKQAEQIRNAKIVKYCGLPSGYAHCSLENFQIVSDDEHFHQKSETLQACKAYVRDFRSNLKAGICMTLLGTVGTGKNHLAAGMINALMKNGFSCALATGYEIARTQHDADFSPEDIKANFQAKFRHFERCDLLVIDEIQQQLSEREALILRSLINARYSNNKPVLMLGNGTVKEVMGSLGVHAPALLDRMRDRGGKIIEMRWPSYRKVALADRAEAAA